MTREEKYKIICEATEKTRNDDWYSARHEVRMRKIKELEEEDRSDFEETRKRYLKEAGIITIDEEPDPLKRIILRGLATIRQCKNTERV